jgi:hypothetical protein
LLFSPRQPPAIDRTDFSTPMRREIHGGPDDALVWDAAVHLAVKQLTVDQKILSDGCAKFARRARPNLSGGVPA